MPKQFRVRLVDIAERLNLSKVSISKALRDHPDIPAETRALVKETAEEMGYVPNMLARSLSSNMTRTIGVVVPHIAYSFFSNAINGIYERASRDGYEIVLTVSQEDADIERKHIKTLLSMRVDGLLVSVSQGEADLRIYERVREMGVPLVFFDRMIRGLDFSSLTIDDERGAFLAVEHVIKQGYRHVGHIAGYSHINIGHRRRMGYLKALCKYDISPRESWVVEGGFSEIHGYRGFKKLYRQGDMPEAILAVTFPVALGMVDAMRETAPSLEDKIQIIAFGKNDINRFMRRPFICVDQKSEEIGRQAVSRLIEEIGDPDSDVKNEVVHSDLITLEDSLSPRYIEE